MGTKFAQRMKKATLILLGLLSGMILFAGTIEKVFYFSDPSVKTSGTWSTVSFDNTKLSGIPGEPVLPYAEIILLIPPGESAISIDITGENETMIPGSFLLYPQQEVQPTDSESTHDFIKKEAVYRMNGIYPARPEGQLMTQYMNGYALAISSFSPVKYNPAEGTVSYYAKVTVRINTSPDAASAEALKSLVSVDMALTRVRSFAQNPEMTKQYPQPKAPATAYQYLIITPALFQNEFQSLINLRTSKGLSCQVKTTESISSTMTGYDLQEKIRNYIKDQYLNNQIQYVLLAGNNVRVPARGFYCYVQSGGGYTDSGIPADLYYSGMDGTYDLDNDHIYAEITDNPDLLPEISVGRFPVNDTAELRKMIRKTIGYETNPVFGEMNKPLLAGEWLYGAPLTLGGSYMNLLINNHSDNGYYTHGIPSSTNSIEKLYDSITPSSSVWSWTASQLIAKINSGKSFIHHLGHANTSYMLRMNTSDITDANFSQVNGITHNFQILYTQGCYDGAFDQANCVSSKAVTINNFLVAGVFNSRYGWFDEGTTEGPSEHLEREFVSALYNDTLPEKHMGTCHMISKIKTVPFISLPGEFEPGAQRWCQYCCNAFGDPALEIWTADPVTFTTATWTGAIDTDWNKAGNWNPASVPTTLSNVVIPNAANMPAINTNNTIFCHDLVIQSGSTFTINPGKSVFLRGSVILNGNK